MLDCVASENKLDSEDFSRYRRFAASGAMTAEEQEQRVLYANILEYEHDHVSAWKDAKCNITPFCMLQMTKLSRLKFQKGNLTDFCLFRSGLNCGKPTWRKIPMMWL